MPDDPCPQSRPIAHYGGDPSWTTVRPPLSPLTPEQAAVLIEKLNAKGFAMPGLRQ